MKSFAALATTLGLASLADHLLFGAFLGCLTDDLAASGIVVAVPACIAVFTAPSLLVAGLGARLVDRYGVRSALRIIKVAELAVALGFAAGASLRSGWLALALMGAKAGVLAPVKYASAPRLVDDREALLRSSMLVASVTAVAILAGIVAGYLAVQALGFTVAGLVVVVVSAVGLAASFLVRSDDTADEPAPLVTIVKSVRLSLLGIGWFWFFATLTAGMLAPYTLVSLHMTGRSALALVVCLAVGFIVGARLCAWLSRGVLEIGVVPAGAIGSTVFTAMLCVGGFVSAPAFSHAAFAVVMIGMGAAWQVVPLYAFVQDRTGDGQLARVFALSDRVSSTFVLAAAAALWACVHTKVSPHWFFLGLAFANLAVAVVIYQIIPEFLLRFVIWLLAHVLYRVRIVGRENLPRHGPAVLVCNHVTFIDWLIIGSASPLPARFVMHYSFMKIPVARIFFRGAKIIPIAGAKEDPVTLEQAFERIASALADNEIVCIFPEGKLTTDGAMNVFRSGIEKIIARTPVPVTPMALVGLWGSFFSKSKERGVFKRVWSRVTLIVDPPLAAAEVSAAGLEARVRGMVSGAADQR